MIEIAQVRNMTDAELVQAIADAKRPLAGSIRAVDSPIEGHECRKQDA